MFKKYQEGGGDIKTILISAGILLGFVFVVQFFTPHGVFVHVEAQDTATTTVFVLNTPPTWVVDAHEDPASTTSTPTNVGSSVTWKATANDSNADDYYLLICKHNIFPFEGSYPGSLPDCVDQTATTTPNPDERWARSSVTAANTGAVATYTALDTDDQVNDWYAWICDWNEGTPRCNENYTGHGSPVNVAGDQSPFYVNHRPFFTAFVDDSPHEPGDTITWYSTSSDPNDLIRGGSETDYVKLVVCKDDQFNANTGTCVNDTWCESDLVSENPSCFATTTVPMQDRIWDAYGFVVDEHGFASADTAHGSNSEIEIANVAPFIEPSSIELLNWSGTSTDPLILSVSADEGTGETGGFIVNLEVSDNNSCEATDPSPGSPEIVGLDINVYRQGTTTEGFVGFDDCREAGDYDYNRCYPAGVGTSTWAFSCSRDALTCGGPDDTSEEWNCTFPLYFLAEATDAISQFPDQKWYVSAMATDNNGATSTLVEADNDTQGAKNLGSFMSFILNTMLIDYEQLEVGEQSGVDVPVNMSASGNTGLNQNMSGEHMCPDFPSCDIDLEPERTIAVENQRFASSTTIYDNGTPMSTSTPAQPLEIKVPKSTSTMSLANRNAYFGIRIPLAITFAGEYFGQNTIQGVTSPAVDW